MARLTDFHRQQRPYQQRPFALVLHLHQHQSSSNLHLQYLAKNQSTQCCQILITPGSDHPPVLEPHMVLKFLERLHDSRNFIVGKKILAKGFVIAEITSCERKFCEGAL
jgi:hypothetical protein